jgi:hypothetical protein
MHAPRGAAVRNIYKVYEKPSKYSFIDDTLNRPLAFMLRKRANTDHPKHPFPIN